MHPNKKIYLNQSASSKSGLHRKPNSQVALPKELVELQNKQAALQLKIQEIENRQRFGYSQPLQDYLVALMKEDIGLSCQINDFLIRS